MICSNSPLAQELGGIKQTFLIAVAILEGRYYAWPNMDSFVMVQALGKTETTGVVRASDSPYYNEYFTFDKKVTLEKILNSEIIISVIQPRSVFRSRKILGSFKLDVATLWAEPEHQFYNKWAILNAPLTKKYVSGSRGFLKVNISLITKNISPAIPPTKHDNEIEGNLLLPHSKLTGRFRAKFEFNIYRAENLHDKNKAPSSHIEVVFAGRKGKTVTRTNNSFPVFNEKIVLRDLFPPLCQLFHINIYFGSALYSSYCLHLKYLISEAEDGHLPSFGPAFLHFYDNKHTEEYQGSLLMSLSTKLESQTYEDKRHNYNLQISPLAEVSFSYVVLRFFGIIFESSALETHFDGKVIFRASIENLNMRQRKGQEGGSTGSSYSDKIEVKKINRNSSFMVIKEKKPMLSFAFNAIDLRKKLYNLNMLDKIAKEMERKLEDIGELFAKDDISLNQKISKSLTDCLDVFHSSAMKYLDIAGNYKLLGLTDLDKAKLKDTLKAMEDATRKAKEMFNKNAARKTFLKIKRLSDDLICLSEYINDTWPDIFITVWKDKRKLAYVRIPCKDVLYSQIKEEAGVMCGTMATLYLQTEKKKIARAENVTSMVGKVEVLLWLGADKFAAEVLKNLPMGYEEHAEDETSPFRYVTSKEIHVFQCRCHLFQGRVKPGYDSSALSDTMARIHLGDDCQETTIEHQTLNPVWNQTLIFKKITLYGNISFIKLNPPTIIIELLDRDKYFFWEFIGKTSVKPLVKTKEEPYGPPMFPPKLNWIKMFNEEGTGAEILGAFEMLEISGEVDDDKDLAEKDIIRIPDDIKPTLVSFRMEVLFWGVRSLEKVMTLHKPRISVECVKTILQSDSLKDVKSNSNFVNSIKTVELELPSEFEYASPLIIKMMDSKKFGIHVFAGTFIRHLKYFLWKPITENERNDLLMGKIEYLSRANVTDEVSSEDSQTNQKMGMVFLPQLCFCRTAQKKKLVKKTSQIRCVCQKTRWQKFRQAFHRKKIICPCLKEYSGAVDKIEKEHKKTCACCRKILEKLHCATSEAENQPGFWSLLRDVFKSSCLGEKCACCKKISGKIKDICSDVSQKCSFCQRICRKIFKQKQKKGDLDAYDDEYDNSSYDWWTKYYTSLEPESKSNERPPIKMKYRLKIYPRELESLPEFENLNDILMSFPMFKGKRTGDEIIDKDMITGVFKGAIKIYRWPPPPGLNYVTRAGQPLINGYYSHFPSNISVLFTLRVYCVRALHLPPKDLNGKCDPYLLLRLNEQEVNDEENYKNREVNPIFGKMFEFNGSFPRDHTLIVQVWDKDTATGDDLIGETSVDIENRLYTSHRANCGLPEFYEETGYCAWRDQNKPSVILSRLCAHWNLPKPVYGLTSVGVCSRIFEPPHYESSGNDAIDREVKALYALRNWHEVPYIGCRLVPEYVETRSLYNSKKALVEQGKLQLWIDIFTSRDLPPPRPVEISVKPPVQYELRVIIWNTADVLLQEDDFFTGQKKSDIFVKGFLLGHDNIQTTDVHYRSLTGEGNFNWRFIFSMEYLTNVDKTVISRKEGVFESKPRDIKFPCRLTLQVWENDTFSKDDFLGTLSLDLSHMPRGSKSSEKCSLSIIEPNVPHINLFRTKRTRGWWPFRGKDLDGNLTLVGKVEAELEMMDAEEAKKSPAGLGRSPPQALSQPKRPDTSFSWFLNPFKTCKHVVCKLHRWKIIKCCCCLLLFVFMGLAIYAFPGYMVKRILHV